MEGRFYRHIKSGNYYWVVNDGLVIEKTLEPAVAYTRVNRTGTPTDDVIWVRPLKEFEEKFKLVKLKEGNG